MQEQVEGSGGEAGAGEPANHDVPGEDVAGGHVGEDGEGVGEGAAEAGVGGDELGGEEDVGVEAGAKEEGVEPAEGGVGGGGVEEGVVVGDGGGGGGGEGAAAAVVESKLGDGVGYVHGRKGKVLHEHEKSNSNSRVYNIFGLPLGPLIMVNLLTLLTYVSNFKII